MIWLTNLQQYLASLDKNRLYQYLGALIGTILFIMTILIFNYYRKTSRLKAEIEQTNDIRQEIKTLLDQARDVKAEQKEIDTILANDPNFKIAGYFEELIEKLNLSNKKDARIEITTPAREGKYQETILHAKFNGMNMEELVTLLQEIDKNKRVFSKELDIVASKKAANSIDVSLTIAALEPKGQTELGE
jgi:hypothetical protein